MIPVGSCYIQDQLFAGWIRNADPRHPDAVASGCDRGGSTTS